MKARWHLWGLALALVGMAACATDVGTIDRTQNDKLEKKMFAGLWYLAQTVIDIPQSGAFSFVGETNFGATGKVVFDIQEDKLIVYPVSEYIEDSENKWHVERLRKYWDDACLTRESEDPAYNCIDGKDNLGTPSRVCCYIEQYVGQPVAIFAIQSHFDVMRQYNAQTGEQTNVIVENTSDKRWWQRKHMRVNWARNQISDYTFMARMIDQTPVDYYVQEFEGETGNPDAPTFTSDYIDVVTKVYGAPASTGSCDIYGVSYGDCAPAIVKFRTAFRKVDPDQNYEPLRFHNESEQYLFGYFLTERNAYDEDWGLTESGKVSYINRWNLWANSFAEQEVVGLDGKPKPCFKDWRNTGCDTRNIEGSKEFCKADEWYTHGTCVLRTPLPYTERGLRPVVFTVSPDLPELLWPATMRMADQWSKAFKDTVAWLYFWEEKGEILGQTQVRDCETNADCAGHALVDATFELDRVDGDNLPKNASGRVLWASMAKTLIALPGQGVTMPDWRMPDGMAARCAVRLVNVTGNQNLDLTVAGVPVMSNVPALTGDSFNPDFPAHALVDAGLNVTFEVPGIGTANADCPANHVVTVVATGNAVYTATTSKAAATISGLRVINATGTALDVSINGGLRFGNLQPGANTGYMEIGGGGNGTNLPSDFMPQRLVATPAGTRGDLTCYRSDQIAKCVGYGHALSEQDWDRFEEIQATLPEMFVLCRNSYTPKNDQTGALNDDQWQSRMYAPWTAIKNATQQQLDELPLLNPCVDFLFAADKMTPAEKLAQAQSMKKIGDARYSSVNWVSEAQFSSPLGYGPSSADPDSGQIFWATANIYGAFMYYYANLYRDLFDLISGKLSTSDYVLGENVREWVAGKGAGSREAALQTETVDSMISMPDTSAELRAAMQYQVDPAIARTEMGRPVSHMDMINVIRDKGLARQLQGTLPALSTGRGKARLNAVRGTTIEHLLQNTEVQMAADAGHVHSHSPLDWATLQDLNQKERERQQFLSNHNYCFADFSDEGMIGGVKSWACIGDDPRPRCTRDNFDPLDVSTYYQNKCCIDDGPLLAEAILMRFYTAVVEHEVGHTVGLRHNFAASTDVFNYFDGYYDIRAKEPIPCTIDSECEQVFGQYCDGGYCHQRKATTCSKAADCGYILGSGSVEYYDTFDCVSGQCVELTRCGLQGQCPEGMVCNGADRNCYENVGGTMTRKETPVAGGSDTLVRQMIPRGPLNANEIDKNRVIYQYSSIMDYGQRWNSDILELGKYDTAAIRFGYGMIVDVYQNTRKLQDSIHQYAQAYGYTSDTQTSDNLDTSYWNWGIYFSQLYYLNNYIGIEANRTDGGFARNRAAVPYNQLRLEQEMVNNYYRQLTEYSRVMVPYKFSGDEYNGNVGVYTWDTGMDPLEIVHNFGISLKDYYLMDAFKRDRYGFGLNANPYSYMSRLQSRYMDAMRGSAMYYALFAHILKNYGWRAIWANARMMGWGLRRASETGFEILANSLSSPAPGSYKLDPGTQMFRNISYDTGALGSEMDIGLGLGKYPYTRFSEQSGYFYWKHAASIGSFWEKMAAMMTLTDSTVYFTTNYVGEQLNIGVGTSIGFNTMYPRQLTEVFGGMVAGDSGHFAWDGDGTKAAPRKYFDEFNMDAYTVTPSPYLTQLTTKPTRTVEPSIDNITMKAYLMLFGMAYLPASFDPSFLDSFAICVVGSGNCSDIGPNSGIVPEFFTDPFGGKTYRVWAPTYRTDWYSPNVALVRKAQAQLAAWEAATDDAKIAAEMALRESVEVLDLMRGLYEVYSAMRI